VRVLVVEDQVDLAEDIVDAFVTRESALMSPTTARWNREGVDEHYDVVVLDAIFQGARRRGVCRLVGASSPARILMLTAAGAVNERVEGLNLGADDYLSKPLPSPNWWHASWRCRVASRPPAVTVRGNLVFDRGRRRVSRAGTPISLNRKEMASSRFCSWPTGPSSAPSTVRAGVDEHADPFSRTVT